MAMSFNGSNQYFFSTDTVNGAPVKRLPISLAAWCYPIVSDQGDSIVTFAVSTQTRSWVKIGEGTSVRWGIMSQRVDTGAAQFHIIGTSNTVRDNQWQFVGGWLNGVCTAGSDCTVTSAAIFCSATGGPGTLAYDRGDLLVNKPTVNPYPILPSGSEWNRVSIGAQYDSNVGEYMNAYIAEVAAWNVILTDDEFRSLGRGVKPNMIRPENLMFYVPGIRDANEFASGITFATGTTPPTFAEHTKRYG